MTTTPPPTSTHAATSRAVWIGFALITGVLVGASAGLLSVPGYDE
jgi:F0F1-type ATP synthase assembly protein I